MERLIIGVDIGTGSTKAVAVNPRGVTVARSQRFYEVHSSVPGASEQDPEFIFQEFLQTIKLLTDQVGNAEAIVLSSAMHSVIPVDDNGKPLSPMLLWSDTRSRDAAEEILKRKDAASLYRTTGTPIHAMSPLAKICWLRSTGGEVFRKTARFISIKEYIWQRLLGVYEVDISVASATGLLDLHRLTWDVDALAIAGIRSDQLSTPVATRHHRMLSDKSLLGAMGLSAKTTLIIGASDGCLANIGSFALDGNTAAITIGTSGAIRVTQNEPRADFDNMVFSYRLDEKTFICGGATNNGGATLRWYASQLLEKKIQTAADFLNLLSPVTSVPAGAEGLLFLPYLLGERAPIWNSNATGTFFNIRAHHQQKHFTRAVLEGICFALRHIGESLQDTGARFTKLHVSGGFIHSREWLQILADVFQMEVRLLTSDDASAVGAAFLGWKAMGEIKRYDQLQPPPGTDIPPNLQNKESYDKAFERYKQLVKKVMPLMST